MQRGSCPCTALTLTRNSAKTLEQCLKSGLFCKEHLILDGGSTDGTLEIARRYGCRVLPQDRQCLSAEGRITDYSGIRNQGIKEAAYDWIVMIDSDEYLDEDCVREVERIVREESPGAYEVNRLYTYKGHIIRHASTYPNRQIRFFHKNAVTKFIKVVHERPELKPGFTPKVLPGVQYVPLLPLHELREKFERYLPLEIHHVGRLGLLSWVWLVIDKHLRLGMRFLRIIRDRLLHRWSDCLPLRYEFLYFRYAWAILWRTCPLL